MLDHHDRRAAREDRVHQFYRAIRLRVVQTGEHLIEQEQ
jgi:hypothetical protein